MLKTKVIGVGLLLLAAISPIVQGQGGPPIGGGGACTNLGCVHLTWMYSPAWAGQP